MKANQTGSRRFATLLKAARRSDRAMLISNYASWIRAGAKAQGRGMQILGVVGVGAAFAAIDGWFSGFHAPLFLGACTVGALVGIVAFVVASRREKRWRQANPWKEPEG